MMKNWGESENKGNEKKTIHVLGDDDQEKQNNEVRRIK